MTLPEAPPSTDQPAGHFPSVLAEGHEVQAGPSNP